MPLHSCLLSGAVTYMAGDAGEKDLDSTLRPSPSALWVLLACREQVSRHSHPSGEVATFRHSWVGALNPRMLREDVPLAGRQGATSSKQPQQ